MNMGFGINNLDDSRKVVVMDRFRSGKSLSPLRQVEAYWTALRVGSDVPRRSQIDPRGLENLLEFAFVLERIAPGIARFRLAGQHLNGLAGMEVRGMPITAFFTPAARQTVSATLEHVFDAPAVAELTLASEARRGTSFEARMIWLPLQSDLGDISRLLGVLVADGAFGNTPCRFNVTNSELRPVTARREEGPLPMPAPAFPDQSKDPARGFAEAQTSLSGRAPHLRLVKSDE